MSSPLQLLCLCTLFAAVAANPARAAKEAASGAGAIPVSIRDLHDEKYYSKSVSVTGTIVDVLSDETDPSHLFFVISDDEGRTTLAPMNGAKHEYDRWRALVGARVQATGNVDPYVRTEKRSLQGVMLNLHAPGGGISVLTPPPNFFDVPVLMPSRQTTSSLGPADIAHMDRRRTRGRVMAVWRRSALLKTPEGFLTRVDFAEGKMPSADESIEVVGFPETDLYRVNFSRAIWRPTKEISVETGPLENVTARFLMTGTNGEELVQFQYHGRRIRISGHLHETPSAMGQSLLLEDDRILFSVEANGELPEDLKPGSKIEVTGTCMMDIDNWRLHNPFPQIRGFFVVIRGQEDIRVISRPPWWTPARLTAVIGTLLAVLFAILIWNVALHKLAARKGRELLHEQIEHLKAELKTEERTRLAVELHDSLAQNLTGVSLEIDTAKRLAEENDKDMRSHLNSAANALKSCREELRNCLWDLRNQALEENDMTSAILRTLAPHIQGVDVKVRFNVPRARFSDNTAHAILRIIRELSLNAVRHGHATSIRVAGSIENDKLLFSVSDNGSGFDPASAPGFAEGHYGLLGIQERIAGYEGEFKLESAPGAGTKATIILSVPKENT